LNEAYDMIWYK